jgi:hypothetical protein
MSLVLHNTNDIGEIRENALVLEQDKMKDIYKSFYQLFISIPIATTSILICIFNYIITVVNIIASKLGILNTIEHIPMTLYLENNQM